MKKLLLISSLISLLSFSSTISAQAKSRFDGFYAGGEFGYYHGRSQSKELQDGILNDYRNDVRPKGAFLGVFSGFNKVVKNNILLGLEIDYADYINGAESRNTFYYGGINASYPVRVSQENSASIRARLGHIFNDDKSLVYLTTGYTTASIRRTYYDNNYTPNSFATYNTRQHGWTLGFGGEHFISDKVSLRGQYRYSNYRTANIDNTAAYPYIFQNFNTTYQQKLKFEDHSIRIGAAYHF